jgi:hypothetical protein
VVVADKQLDGTHMVGERFGAGQCLAYQTGHALSQYVVDALDEGMAMTEEDWQRLADHRPEDPEGVTG